MRATASSRSEAAASPCGGGRLEFVFCDVFTFRGDAIGRIETYQVNLSGLV